MGSSLREYGLFTASVWGIILIFVISTSRMYGAGQAWNPLSKNLPRNTWQLLAVPLLTLLHACANKKGRENPARFLFADKN
jgi:hypothetical protein